MLSSGCGLESTCDCKVRPVDISCGKAAVNSRAGALEEETGQSPASAAPRCRGNTNIAARNLIVRERRQRLANWLLLKLSIRV